MDSLILAELNTQMAYSLVIFPVKERGHICIE